MKALLQSLPRNNVPRGNDQIPFSAQTKFVNEPLEHNLPHTSLKLCLSNSRSTNTAKKLQFHFEKRRAIIFYKYLSAIFLEYSFFIKIICDFFMVCF